MKATQTVRARMNKNKNIHTGGLLIVASSTPKVVMLKSTPETTPLQSWMEAYIQQKFSPNTIEDNVPPKNIRSQSQIQITDKVMVSCVQMSTSKLSKIDPR